MYERIQVRKAQNLNILHHEIAEIESHVGSLQNIKALKEAPCDTQLAYLLWGLDKYNLQFRLATSTTPVPPQVDSSIYFTPVHLHPLAVALDKQHPKHIYYWKHPAQWKVNNLWSDMSTLEDMRMNV